MWSGVKLLCKLVIPGEYNAERENTTLDNASQIPTQIGVVAVAFLLVIRSCLRQITMYFLSSPDTHVVNIELIT